jgi:hypothetical protein
VTPLVARLRETRTGSAARRSLVFDEREVWWEVRGRTPAPLSVHDMAATALVHRAMFESRDLHIEGPVTRSLLDGLAEYVALWALWRPGYYQSISVTAAEEAASAPANEAAVAAFSGGVDASFTLLRHARKLAGRGSRPIHSAVLIQGFDIPLSADDAFARAERSARETLASLDIPLSVVATNWREVCADWEMEHGAALATCLRNWQGEAGYALIGSDEDFARLVSPWGSHPLHFRMASSDDFHVVYDGGECGRTEKVATLAAWPEGVERLRVCWQGPMTGGNCGHCEKCVRTKLNFLAVGARPPASLGAPPTPADIARLRLRNETQIVYMEEIAAAADARGVREPWVDALRTRVRQVRRLRAIKALPVLAPVKRAWRGLRRPIVTARPPVRRATDRTAQTPGFAAKPGNPPG